MCAALIQMSPIQAFYVKHECQYEHSYYIKCSVINWEYSHLKSVINLILKINQLTALFLFKLKRYD